MPESVEELYVVIGSDISDLLKDTKKGVDAAEKELKKFGNTAEKESKKAKRSFKDIGKNLAAGVAGVVAIFGAAVAAVKKLTDAAVELDVATTSLAVSANAAGREFGASVGNAESWKKTIQELGRELKIYSEKELTNASTRLIDMTKRLGLTEQQMAVLLRRTADLSAGKVNLEGGIERVTAAMRGEAESAEFLGLSLNENTVKAYAEAQGLVWKNLNDTEKAQQRYNLFLEQTNELQGRAAIFADTLAGKEAALTATLENQSAILGEQLLPLREGYAQLILNISQETEGGASVITNVLAGLAASFVAFGASVIATLQNTLNFWTGWLGALESSKDAFLAGEDIGEAIREDMVKVGKAIDKQTQVVTGFGDTWQTAFDDIKGGWDQQRKDQEQASDDFADNPVPDPAKVKEWSEASIKALDNYGNQLLDLQDNIAEQSEQIEQDHIDALADIQDDYTDALADAEADRAQALADAEKTRTKAVADLEKEVAKARKEAVENTRKELEQLAKDTDLALKKERASFNKDELRETEDHLESMRQLRNQYLDSIDDAVKNRDARALVDARKNFHDQEMEQEGAFSKDQRRRREDQSLRLAEIRDEEKQRADEIMTAQDEELSRLSEHEAEKRAEIESSYQEQLVKAQENFDNAATQAQEKREEALTQEQEDYEKEKEQLDEQISERLEQIAKGLADQDDITDEEAKNILETFAKYFGADGEIDKLMDDFANRRAAKLAIEVQYQANATDVGFDLGGGSGPNYNPYSANIPSFATGGTMIANKPTLAQFGEVPEMVQFTPLSQMNNGGNRPRQVDVNVNMSGSAPPGVRSADRDQIGAVLANALIDAGLNISQGERRGS